MLIGETLGPYRVLDKLGEGGMGQVYRARDTRLNRDVALKVLPELFAADAERLARFDREAKTLAALNHPHIAQIYGAEQVDDIRALVIELVEGEDLAQRIARGALPFDEAIRVAKQIAEALEAAHELGIVHRDLKPANVKLRPDGSVKVLDFGLAKALALDPASGSGGIAESPTLTTPAATRLGVILGTAAYMSPEQARGRPVDKRADIWAFGCVLYEMLAGHRVFDGEAVTEALGAVIHKEPDWSALPATVPPAVRTVLQRCLEKDPKRRLRDIGDVHLALDGAFESRDAPAPIGRPPARRAGPIAAVAAIAALVGGAGVWVAMRPEPAARPSTVRFSVTPSSLLLSPFLALSPDGRRLAFFAADAGALRLFVHSFESGETRMIQRAGVVSGAPFWSPDSRFVAYTGQSTLQRIDPAGGPPEAISAISGFAGGTWGEDGIILFADPNAGVMRVPAAGGSPTLVTKLDPARQETTHSGPWFLPGGRRFLYLRSSSDSSFGGAYVGDVDRPAEEQDLTRVLPTQQNPLYAPDGATAGHVLFVRDGTLMAQAFDHVGLTLTGEAVRVADQVGVGSGNAVSYAQFSVSTTGVLVFRRGLLASGSLAWVSRAGQETPAIAGPFERPAHPQLSPDGRKVAMVVGGNLWVYDIEGRPPIKLTFDAGIFSPLWTVDGGRIAFELKNVVFAVPADGSGGAPTPMSPATGHFHPYGWSADGRDIVLTSITPPSQSGDVVKFTVGQPGDPQPIVATPASEGFGGAAVSPDGRWLAYVSDQTGAAEIWVRPFSGPGPASRLSPNGGVEPVWARNGRELFYREQNRLMAVAIAPGTTFNFGTPTLLFESRYVHLGQPPTYDVAADGRFLMIKGSDALAEPFHVVLNWLTAGATAREEGRGAIPMER